MVNMQPMISAAQIRAGRAWLSWTQEALADKAGVSKRAVVRAESGSSVPHPETAAKLQAALEEAGLQFRFEKMVGTGVEISKVKV